MNCIKFLQNILFQVATNTCGMLSKHIDLKRILFFKSILGFEDFREKMVSHLSRTRHSKILNVRLAWKNSFVLPKCTLLYVSKCTQCFILCLLLSYFISHLICRVRDKLDLQFVPYATAKTNTRT